MPSPALRMLPTRLLWAVVPVAAGAAFADALEPWSTAPRVAAALLWIAWAAAMLALLAPRPWGLTLVRIAAPLAVLLTIATIPSTSTGAAFLAIVAAMIAAVFALAAPMNEAAGNALAYGDEVRAPLRIPTPLFLGPVPFGVLLVGAGIATGPIALADSRVGLGVVGIVLGFPCAFIAARALHGLSRRWLVVVPAGITVVDPMSLLDPVLVRRPLIAGLHRVYGTKVDPGVLDIRLGTIAGGIAMGLAEPVAFGQRRGRRGGRVADFDGVVVAVVRANAVIKLASTRRIPTA